MDSDSRIFLTRPERAKKDTSLRPEDGWHINIGWLIDSVRMGSTLGSVGYAVVPPGGGRHEPHVHENAEEVAIYLKGRGLRMVGDQQYEVGPMDIGFAPIGIPHGIRNLSDTEPIEIICVYLGVDSVEKTGYRLATAEELKRPAAEWLRG